MTAAELLRRRLAAREPAYGSWAALGTPLSGEILARLGFAYVCVDLQHGLDGLDTLASAVQGIAACGSLPIARVPGNEPWVIGRALDLGAGGVVVPLVSSAEEAERAARACRYPPDGTRSYGRVRVAAPELTEQERNERVFCFPMVETQAAVVNLEAIASTPGVDGVYVGPRDLALDHGLEAASPELRELLASIARRAREVGVPAGIHTPSGEAARAAIETGYTFATIASDRELLAVAARRELAAALGDEPARRTPADDDLLRAATGYVR